MSTTKHVRIAVAMAAVLAAWTSAALARPGDGIQIGDLRLSPFVEVSVTYDDNVYLDRPDETEDFFLDLIPGLAFINRTDRLILTGRAWGQWRWYQDETDLDSEAYGEKLGLVWGEKERLTLALNEKWVKVEDYEITPRSVDILNLESQILMLTEDRTERVERELFDISPILAYDVTDTFGFNVGYSYNFVDYTGTNSIVDPGSANSLFDWYENRLQVEVQQKLTEKSFLVVTAQGSQQDSDGFEDTSDYYILRGGLLYRATAKTSFKGTAGVEDYDFAEGSVAGDDLDVTVFNFDVAGMWEITDKLDMELSARNAVQPATQYEANTKEVTLGSLGFIYEMTTTLKLTLAGSVRRDDYIGDIILADGTGFEKRRDLWGARARLDYSPRAKWLNLWLESTYEDVDDNLEDDYDDYDQWRLSLGAALRY